MAIRAYILIKVEAGGIRQVIRNLRRLKNVISADLVTGPYDAIVVLEATDMNEIAELVVDRITRIPGVASTITCLAIKTSNKLAKD
ncbi:Lrp/AsnC ligand binding domain-containing protein [Chloroflexota bacterium]